MSEEAKKKYGIEPLKKVVDLGVSIGDAVQSALEDGKVNLADLPYLYNPAMAIIGLVSVVGQIPKSFADLDEEEKAELSAYANEVLDLPDDKLERLIERSFKVALEIGDLIEDALSKDDVEEAPEPPPAA